MQALEHRAHRTGHYASLFTSLFTSVFTRHAAEQLHAFARIDGLFPTRVIQRGERLRESARGRALEIDVAASHECHSMAGFMRRCRGTRPLFFKRGQLVCEYRAQNRSAESQRRHAPGFFGQQIDVDGDEQSGIALHSAWPEPVHQPSRLEGCAFFSATGQALCGHEIG